MRGRLTKDVTLGPDEGAFGKTVYPAGTEIELAVSYGDGAYLAHVTATDGHDDDFVVRSDEFEIAPVPDNPYDR